MIGAVSAEEKRAIPSHLQQQVAALVDPDDLVQDIESAIENIVAAAGRAQRALHKGDYHAACDILKSAGAELAEVMS